MPAKPRKQASSATANAPALRSTPAQRNGRDGKGKFVTGNRAAGYSAPANIDLARARKNLNLLTIEAMTDAFRKGGREAIAKVMKNAPAQFLKMAVLLVPRELEVTHSGGVKGMSDEQLERGIEALEAILSRRAAKPGDDAKLVEGVVAEEPSASDP